MNIIEWIKNNVMKIITVPVVISTGNFAVLLVQSLSDGVITEDELHMLIKAGSGIQLVCLALVMGVLKIKK